MQAEPVVYATDPHGQIIGPAARSNWSRARCELLGPKAEIARTALQRGKEWRRWPIPLGWRLGTRGGLKRAAKRTGKIRSS
jgi:hypothetical protein